ncbi:HBL/NHE enterotoxin family protein [Bacillus fungorum]|uniref:HBL/NHE enterotoxin family protein n=1 Tax=Bacillus fungorum TaxID=2039284 RepID=UPI0033957D96
MYKRLYKKILLTATIVGLTTSNIMPLHVLASEMKKSIPQETLYMHSLKPSGLSETLSNNISNVRAIDSYTKEILKKHEGQAKNAKTIINNDLQQHQIDAVNNAEYWEYTLNPLMLQIIQDVINYNDIFQANYSILLTAVNQKNTAQLKNTINKLHMHILKDKSNVDDVLTKLTILRDKMSGNVGGLKGDLIKLKSKLDSTEIPSLQRQINHFNDVIKDGRQKIKEGKKYVSISSIGIAMKGVKLREEGQRMIDTAEKEITELQRQISEKKSDVNTLSNTLNMVTNMTEKIEVTILSINKTSNQWGTMGSKYINLLENLKDIKPEEFEFLKEDINTARDSWQNIREYADILYK